MKRSLLSGNEAIALGAYHAGAKVGAAYPGTPSTEILENFARYPEVYAEWAPNEKVALEVATGASYAGARAIATMKHVGLNVAADSFFAVAVTGVYGGLVIVSADDPAMHSSQNEQDNRNYAKFAKVPLLEPSDSQEAYELTRLAFDLSERFDTPVLLRTTTRISHSKTVVRYDETIEWKPRALGRFKRSPEKLVMIPAYARKRRVAMEKRLEALADFAETFEHNRMIPPPGVSSSGSAPEDWRAELGIITSGAAANYAREVFPEAAFLKLALPYPLPVGLVRSFAERCERVLVIEELDPFLEEMIRGQGISVEGKRHFSPIGELSLEAVEHGLLSAFPERALASETLTARSAPAAPTTVALPPRPPVLCPGCPHTAAFYAIRRVGFYRGQADASLPDESRALAPLRTAGAVVTGDIGCYTLGVLSPLLAIDTTGCMGASIGNGLGMEKAGLRQKVISVIGDSTFLHTGIQPLLDVVYNGGQTTTVILDNSTTAMTGHQEHPGTGYTLKGKPAPKVNIEGIVRALGVSHLQTVDAFNLLAVEDALRDAAEHDGPSVIVVRGECALTKPRPTEAKKHSRSTSAPGSFTVDRSLCDGCAACVRLGCPAIGYEDDKATIDPLLCVGEGCGVCRDVCPKRAINLATDEMLVPISQTGGNGGRA